MLAVRSNERAAAAAGINVRNVKLAAFGISSFIAGISGALYGYNFSSVTVNRFSALTALSLIALAYVGGITMVSGAIFAGLISVEALFPYALEKWFDISGNYALLFAGLALIVTLIQNPDGVAGATYRKHQQRKRRRAAAARGRPVAGEEHMTDRILTTHVGALQRTPEAESALLGEAPRSSSLRPSPMSFADRSRPASTWSTTASTASRSGSGTSPSGWEASSAQDLRGLAPLRGRDHLRFPDFYAYAQETPDVLFHGRDRAFWAAIATRPVCVGPITYDPTAVQRDIANLKAALDGVEVADAFMPVVAPASAEVDMGNEHYATQEELLWALADALREEYRAIVDAGFQLQVDDAWIPRPVGPRARTSIWRPTTRIAALADRGAEPRAGGTARGARPLPRLLGQLARPARDRHPARGDRRPHARGATQAPTWSRRRTCGTSTSTTSGRPCGCRRARSSHPAWSRTRRT